VRAAHTKTLAGSMQGKMSLLHQAAEMVLQRVAAGTGGAAVQADAVDDLEVQFG